MTKLQLANENNWQNIWSESFQAEPVANNLARYRPIEEISVPVLFNRNVIAVYAVSSTAKPRWKFAGLLKQKLQLGLIVGGLPDAVGVKIRKIWLNQVTLIEFENLADSYAVSFDIPYWLEQISLTVWQYTGPQAPEDVLHTDLLQDIKSKVDDIASYGR